MTVVGIGPSGFHGVEVGESVDVFVPIMMQPQVIPTWSRGIGDWRVRFYVPDAQTIRVNRIQNRREAYR